MKSAFFLLAMVLAVFAGSARAARTPVILDTDIGDDTDDCWALVYALKDPQLDVKLITTTYGKQQYRAALVAKFLTVAGRTDIPIGLGAGSKVAGKERMQGWLGDFTLAAYHGKILQDGAAAIVETVNNSPLPMTFIAIGPLNTIGAALQKDPAIAAKSNLAAMAGSIRISYGNKPGQTPEYNVWADISDAGRVLSAPWKSIAITPLDTGCSSTIVGTRYYRLLAKGDPLVQSLLLNSALAHNAPDPAKINFSGSGFDNIAVYLAEQNPSRFATLENLKITVDKTGKTIVDPAGREMRVATSWKNLNGFLDHVVDTLLLPTSAAEAPAKN